MAKAETKEKPEAKESFRYGVEDVAKALGIKSASARVQLRNNNVKKAGKSYGWNSKTEVEDVVKKLKGSEKKSETKATTKKTDAKPAKKAAKPAKKAEAEDEAA